MSYVAIFLVISGFHAAVLVLLYKEEQMLGRFTFKMGKRSCKQIHIQNGKTNLCFFLCGNADCSNVVKEEMTTFWWSDVAGTFKQGQAQWKLSTQVKIHKNYHHARKHSKCEVSEKIQPIQF